MLQHAPPGHVRDALLLLAARRHELHSALAREQGEHAKALGLIQLARQLVAQAVEERSQRGASLDLELSELVDSIEAGAAYMAGLIQLDTARAEVADAVANPERIPHRRAGPLRGRGAQRARRRGAGHGLLLRRQYLLQGHQGRGARQQARQHRAAR
jgi:hypothetical protein